MKGTSPAPKQGTHMATIDGRLPSADTDRHGEVLHALRLAVPLLRTLSFDPDSSTLTVEQQGSSLSDKMRHAARGAANLSGLPVVVKHHGKEVYRAAPADLPVLFHGLDAPEQAARLGRRDAQLLNALFFGDGHTRNLTEPLKALDSLLTGNPVFDVEMKCGTRHKVIVEVDSPIDAVATRSFSEFLASLSRWEDEFKPHSLVVVIRPSHATVQELITEKLAHAGILSSSPEPGGTTVQVKSISEPALDALEALRARTGWQISCSTVVDCVIEPPCAVINPSRAALLETEKHVRQALEIALPVDRTIIDLPHGAIRIIAPLSHLSPCQIQALTDRVPLRSCRLQFTDARRALTPHEVQGIVQRLVTFFPKLHTAASINADDQVDIVVTNDLVERVEPWYGEFLHTVERIQENAQTSVRFTETIDEPTVRRAWDTLTKGQIRSQIRFDEKNSSITLTCDRKDEDAVAHLAPLLHHWVGCKVTVSAGLRPLEPNDQEVRPSTPLPDGKLPIRSLKVIAEVLPRFLPVADVTIEHGVFLVRHRLGPLPQEFLKYLGTLLPAGRTVVFRPSQDSESIRHHTPPGKNLTKFIEHSLRTDTVLHRVQVNGQGTVQCTVFANGASTSFIPQRSLLRNALERCLERPVTVTFEAIHADRLRTLVNTPPAFRSVLAQGVDARGTVVCDPELAQQRLFDQQVRIPRDSRSQKASGRVSLEPLNIALLSADPGPTTLVEQAISLEQHGPLLRLGVHIFDPSDFLHSPRIVDRLVAQGTSVYFDEHTGLKTAHLVRRNKEFGFSPKSERPSLSLFITLNKYREIAHWAFARTSARLREMLTIDDFNTRAESGGAERALCDGMETVFKALNRKFGPHLNGMPQDGAAAMLTYQSAVVVGTLAGELLRNNDVPYLQGVRTPRDPGRERSLRELAERWGAPVGGPVAWTDTLRALGEKFGNQRDLLEQLAFLTSFNYQLSSASSAKARPDASITAPLRRTCDALTLLQITELLQRGHPSAWLAAAVNRSVNVVNSSNSSRRHLSRELERLLLPGGY